jgi:fatty acid desaturase
MAGEQGKASGTRPGAALLFLELARPFLLLLAFLYVAGRWWWPCSVPLGFAAVLAASVLVHDLIHNALYLPRRLNDLALGVYALFLIKSGHALRRLHLEHHRRCLKDDDAEGNVVYMPIGELLLKGPVLALKARWLSWQAETKMRWAQAIENSLNLALVIALPLLGWRTGAAAPLVYLGCVVAVTVTVPLLGAKLPHLLPSWFPRLVRFLSRWTTRLTPAASSLLFHELHHRRPRIAAALLPENQGILEETERSNCAETYEAKKGAGEGPGPTGEPGTKVPG